MKTMRSVDIMWYDGALYGAYNVGVGYHLGYPGGCLIIIDGIQKGGTEVDIWGGHFICVDTHHHIIHGPSTKHH